MVGAGVLVVLIVATLIGPTVYPVDPEQLDYQAILVPPGTPGHLFGTDELGRDCWRGASTVGASPSRWALWP